MIDVLQPCVSFNKKNTYEWYSKRVYKISDDKSYNPEDKIAAFQKSSEWGDKIPIGIIFKSEKKSYLERANLKLSRPLVEEPIEGIDISGVLKKYI